MTYHQTDMVESIPSKKCHAHCTDITPTDIIPSLEKKTVYEAIPKQLLILFLSISISITHFVSFSLNSISDNEPAVTGKDDCQRVIIWSENSCCCSKLALFLFSVTQHITVAQTTLLNYTVFMMLFPGWQSWKYTKAKVCRSVECCWCAGLYNTESWKLEVIKFSTEVAEEALWRFLPPLLWGISGTGHAWTNWASVSKILKAGIFGSGDTE